MFRGDSTGRGDSVGRGVVLVWCHIDTKMDLF